MGFHFCVGVERIFNNEQGIEKFTKTMSDCQVIQSYRCLCLPFKLSRLQRLQLRLF